MANTANTQEPTMEEILASIRRIISEDGEEAKAAPEAPKAKPAPAAPAPAPAAKPAAKAPLPVVEAEEVEEDVLELTEVVPEEEPAPAAAAPAEDDVVMVERAPAAPMKSAPRAPVIANRARMVEPDDGLLSEEASNQASTAFRQLTRTTLVSEEPGDPRSLEALVQDMLRPLLEDWLNRNLPEIVDRLVQQEIDRVSRKGR
ncbi:MAG TPA: DUF2497 domain-containing protein [Alphaproteobacteria bacterium]|nr:DUF2497 domain-containing protein [Alphaproteobacteria bacterium]